MSAEPEVIGGIGRCQDERCPEYDGKRCRLTGFRPHGICEPWLREALDAAERRGAEAMRAAMQMLLAAQQCVPPAPGVCRHLADAIRALPLPGAEPANEAPPCGAPAPGDLDDPCLLPAGHTIHRGRSAAWASLPVSEGGPRPDPEGSR